MYALYILVFGPVKEWFTCMSKKKTYLLCIYILNVSNFYILCFLRYLIVCLKVSDVAEKNTLSCRLLNMQCIAWCMQWFPALIDAFIVFLSKLISLAFYSVYITVYRNIFVFVKLKVFYGLFLEIKASNNVALQFFYLTFSREKKSHFCSFLKVLKWIVLRTDRPMCAHQFKKFKLYIWPWNTF